MMHLNSHQALAALRDMMNNLTQVLRPTAHGNEQERNNSSGAGIRPESAPLDMEFTEHGTNPQWVDRIRKMEGQ